MKIADITELNLLDEPNYNFTANCFEQTLNFTVTWVARLNKRFISARGSNGDIYLQNTAINIDETLAFNVNAERDDFKCSLLLQHLPDADSVVDYSKWSRNMFLTIYRITEE